MVKKLFYIGLDVHKRSVVYVVRDWNGKVVLEGQCATNFKELWSILEPYMLRCRVAIEASTCFYPLYEGFKSKGIDVLVANVIQLRRLIGKNDKLDAARLSDMLRLNTLPESFIPEKKIQYLRSLCLLRYNYVTEQTRVKNQIHAKLDAAGIKFPLRTSFGKKWCMHLESYIKEIQAFELNILYESVQQAAKKIEKIDLEIKDYTEWNFTKTRKILMSIPGIGPIWSAFIIAQIAIIGRFSDKRKLRRYAGVVPVTDKSANKEKGTYLPKMSSRKLLRVALVQGSHSAVRVKGNLQDYYKKKKKQKQKTQQAIMCVASSLSDIVYHVLKTGKPYQAH